MKEYDWLRDVSYDYGGSFVYVTFNTYDYDKKLGIKYAHWVEEYGDSFIEYFKVNNVLVFTYYGMFFVKSEKEEDVNKVLEYIDKAISL